MNIWQITFSYETPSKYASNITKNVYNVVAATKDEAVAKAYDNFSKTPYFSDLNLSIDDRVKSAARKITSLKVKLPSLTLQEDQENYKISIKISKDRASLEYIVSKKK